MNVTERSGDEPAERILSVEDHGMWRGHRTWTVRIDGPTGPAQVSVLDEKTEARAIVKGLETYRGRRVFTDDERAAMQRANAHLTRNFGGQSRETNAPKETDHA